MQSHAATEIISIFMCRLLQIIPICDLHILFWELQNYTPALRKMSTTTSVEGIRIQPGVVGVE